MGADPETGQHSMIDWWQQFFGSQDYDPNRFTPGGGTFPPATPPSDFTGRFINDSQNTPDRQPWSSSSLPFGEVPGPRYDFGKPPVYMQDENKVDPNMEFRMPLQDIPTRDFMNPNTDKMLRPGQIGQDFQQHVYDPGEMQRLMDELNRTGPTNITNPPPDEDMIAGVPYGQNPYWQPPLMQPGDLENFFQTPGFGPPELFNPNTEDLPRPQNDQGMETIGYNPPPGVPPGQELNVGGEPYIPGSQSPTFSGSLPQSYGPPDFGGFYPASVPGVTGDDFDVQGAIAPTPPQLVPPSVAQTSGEPDFGGFPVGGGTSPEAVNQSLSPNGQFIYNYDQNWNWIGQTPAGPGGILGNTGGAGGGGAIPSQPVGPVNAPYQTPITGANGIVGVNPYSYGPPSTPQGPLAPGNMGAMGPNQQPIIDPMTGLPIAGSILSESDVAKRYNMQQFNDPRYKPSDLLHPGQTFVKLLSDGTRVVVDATGKIISGGIQAGKDLYNNILNDPRNTGSDYLASIGYQPGQGIKSQFPASVTGPSAGFYDTLLGGVAGQGASFFHGSQISPGTIDPNTGQPVMDVPTPSVMNPGGYNYPRHGATSVAGAFSGLGGMGTMANITALSGDIYARKRLREMAQAYSAGRPFYNTPTNALVGGPPPNVFSPAFLQTHPISFSRPGALPTSGPGSIVNPAAFGGVPGRGQGPGSTTRSIHLPRGSTP